MKLLSTLFFTGVLFSSSALAIDNYHIECSTCVTESQFVQAAKDNAVFRQTVFINVMNIKNYEVKKYSVYENRKTVCDPNGREPDGEGGFIQDCWFEKTLTATEVAINNTELNAFIDFAQLQNDIQKITQNAIDVPEDVLGSGYELVGASFNQTAVTQYYNSLPIKDALVEKMGIYFDSATTVLSNSYIKINARPIVFNFEDGTVAHAVLKFEDMDNVVHLEFIQVTDKNGNVIDLTDDTNPFSKQFKPQNLSLTSWQSLLTAFKAYGLAVDVSNTANVPTGIVTITDCSNSTETVCRNPL